MPKIKELKENKDEKREVLKESLSKSKSSKKVESKEEKKEKASSKTKPVEEVEKATKTKSTKAKSVKKEPKEKTSSSKTKKAVAKKETKTAEKKSKVTKTTKATKESTKNSKTTAKKAKKLEQEYLQEYYDLPYRYNETVVKILAQTPKRLFVYWDVSEKDKETYLNAFGEDFFEKTYPVLLVHNEEMNYTFEVPINDFANSWYLDIQDPKTKYVVQLGRKFRNIQDVRPVREIVQKENINLQNDYIHITDSNKLEVPNDHILFETIKNQVTYRNVKTGNEYKKDISDIFEKLSKSYKEVDIEEMYKELYGDEISRDILSNPSSGTLSSSSFK